MKRKRKNWENRKNWEKVGKLANKTQKRKK